MAVQAAMSCDEIEHVKSLLLLIVSVHNQCTEQRNIDHQYPEASLRLKHLRILCMIRQSESSPVMEVFDDNRTCSYQGPEVSSELC